MPPSPHPGKKGFWGVAGPPKGGPCRALLVGPRSSFFSHVLRASAQVETYDEEYDCEAFRRGIRTEERSAATVSRLLASFPRAFPCLLGYDGWPIPGVGTKDAAKVVLSHDVGEAEFLSAGDLLAGHRGGRPSEQAPRLRLLTAREMWAGKGRRRLLPKMPGDLFLVIDPLVMEPGLFPAAENIEPGGLSWYALTAFLKELFAGGSLRGALVRPRRLPRNNPVPAFVVARLVAKILTAAVAGEGARK